MFTKHILLTAGICTGLFYGSLMHAEEEVDAEAGRGEAIAALAENIGPGGEGVQDVVNAATQMHLASLQEVLTKVPEEARAAVQKAIEKSQAGNAKAMKGLQERLKNAKAKGASKEDGQALAREEVARAMAKHQETLAEVLTRVPEEAKPAIERAMESAKKGQAASSKALSGERPAGRPEGTVRPATPATPATPPAPGKPATIPSRPSR